MNRYNQALGLIYKWMNIVLAARKKDVIQRLVVSKRLREERDQKIEEEKARVEERTAACAQAKEDFDNKPENKEANEAYHEYKAAVDAGNPP